MVLNEWEQLALNSLIVYNITGDIMKTLNVTIDHLTKEGVGVTRIEKKPMYIMYAIDGEELKFEDLFVKNIDMHEILRKAFYKVLTLEF